MEGKFMGENKLLISDRIKELSAKIEGLCKRNRY